MTRWKLGWVGLGLLAVVAASPPQAAQTQDAGDDIVVEGRLKTVDRQVRDLANEISQRPRIGKPIPRVYGEFCLGVFGLRTDAALQFLDRVNENARSIGIKVGGDGCAVNSFVGFSQDSRSSLAALKKSSPWLFEDLMKVELKRIERGSGAAQAWHSTQVSGEHGRQMSAVRLNGRDVEVNTGFKASRLQEALRVEVAGSVVLFDNRRVLGKSIVQLADYASMRMFATVNDLADPPGGSIDSILSLFSEDSAPPTLTSFDRAYLNGLYRLPESAQGGAIGDATRAAFWRQPAETAPADAP